MNMDMKTVCLEFLKNPTRNPRTGRTIKIDGPTHFTLTHQCLLFNKSKENTSSDYISPEKSKENTSSNYKSPEKSKKSKENTSSDYRSPKTPEKSKKTPIKLNKPSCAFYIVGLGCSMETIENFEEASDKYSVHLDMPFKYMCNFSLAKTLFHIAKSVCNLPPSSKNAFVVECIQNVIKKLDQGLNVYIVGHSYGGAVANRIAEYFSKTPHVNNANLNIATFGAIYVSNKTLDYAIKIRNYMHIYDVALKCNGCKPSKANCPKITWLTNKSDVPLKKIKKSIFGTRPEWEHHNNYNTLIDHVFNKRTVHIQGEDMSNMSNLSEYVY
jgi:hypothetical protein